MCDYPPLCVSPPVPSHYRWRQGMRLRSSANASPCHGLLLARGVPGKLHQATTPLATLHQAAMLSRDPLIAIQSHSCRTDGSVLVIYNPGACIIGGRVPLATET